MYIRKPKQEMLEDFFNIVRYVARKFNFTNMHIF
jgi:hypothetical protein